MPAGESSAGFERVVREEDVTGGNGAGSSDLRSQAQSKVASPATGNAKRTNRMLRALAGRILDRAIACARWFRRDAKTNSPKACSTRRYGNRKPSPWVEPAAGRSRRGSRAPRASLRTDWRKTANTISTGFNIRQALALSIIGPNLIAVWISEALPATSPNL